MSNPYQIETDQLKAEMLEAYELGKTFKSDYTQEEFGQSLISECHKLNIRFNNIRRSGGHPSEELKIAILAHKELIKELGLIITL